MQFSHITLFPTLDEQQAVEVEEEIIPEPLPIKPAEDAQLLALSRNGQRSHLQQEHESVASWDGPELDGELVVDVYETETHVVVVAPIAGARSNDLDITVVNDLLTIRGSRHHDARVGNLQPLYQECHWGAFSRSIILPSEVQIDRVKAFLKQGMLTVLLPKRFAKNIRVEELESE